MGRHYAMTDGFRMARAYGACLLLAFPLVAVKLWALLAIGSYSGSQFACGALVVLAVSVLVVLVVRWRVAGAMSWLVRFAIYALAAIGEIAEAVSFYLRVSRCGDWRTRLGWVGENTDD